MHVMGVAVVDPTTSARGFVYEQVRELLESRLHLVPPFRRRLVEVPFGLHTPLWIEDPDFDLDYHVRRAAVPAPGGETELAAFVADVASRPLDRSHPLWEVWVVEGLERGYYAFVVKVHHSLIDGASGVEILASLFDLEPEPEPKVADIAPDWEPEHVPSDLELLAPLARSRSRNARWHSSRPPTTSAAASCAACNARASASSTCRCRSPRPGCR